MTTVPDAGGQPGPRSETDEPVVPLSVFINYRREDTAGIAIALYDRLAQRLGPENVFLDVRNLRPGASWLDEIRSHSASCRVFIALIGHRWMPVLRDRQQSAVIESVIDEARREIEIALSRGSGVDVIPVLVDDAVIPSADSLPRSIRALASRQAERLRYTHFDQDVEHLIETLRSLAHQPPAGPRPQPQIASAPAPLPTPPALVQRAGTDAVPGPQIGPPDERHYVDVLTYMARAGTVVPVLGPNAGRISRGLSGRFNPEQDDLAEAAQYVYMVSGRPDLYRSLRQMLTDEHEPSLAHEFFARFPAELERLGLAPRYQLIVTTNYDTELERAFDAANEPYDLAVYMSSGPDAGRFVHFPFQSEPEPIRVPNDYAKFPIDIETYELERTIIVKVHGAVDGSSGGYRWKENYVITEDHYIDYLSASPVESLVPTQILTKLRDSHCLFIGYLIRDWNLRVFLKRIWRGEPLGARSWAIQRTPDVLDREFWSNSRVDLFACAPDDYLTNLSRHLEGLNGGKAGRD